ncbi:hypothetical protein EGW08_003906, partial [Elysia chlorotica]
MASNIHTRYIKILEVRSPWDFLAIDCSDTSPEMVSFVQMMESMNASLNSLTEQGTMTQTPNQGEICAFLRREDNKWHRVRIDSWLEKNKGQYAWCYLIDKGVHETAPTQRLMKLSTKYTTMPSQVLHCSLWGVQPLSLKVEESYTGLKVENRPCAKWDSSASQYMRKTFDTCRKYQIDVIERDSDKLYVRLLLKTKHGTVCFNDVLVNENYALETGEDKSFVQAHHGTAKLIGSMSELESDSNGDIISNCGDMPPLVTESSNTSKLFVNPNEVKAIAHQEDDCPPLISTDALKSIKSSKESCFSPAESMDDSGMCQDNKDCPPLINELEPPVAEFFNRYLSSPDKSPSLSLSPTSLKSDTLVPQGTSHEVFSSMQKQTHSAIPIKSSLASTLPSSSSSGTLTPTSKFKQSQSPQALSFQKFLQGRGRVLSTSSTDTRPGLAAGPASVSSFNSPVKSAHSGSSNKESISNGHYSNHSDPFESDFKVTPMPGKLPQSTTLNDIVTEVQLNQEQEQKNLNVTDSKVTLSDRGDSTISPSSGTRVRFRKSGDAFMEKKSSEANKQMKPVSAKILTLLNTAAPDLRDNAVRQARGQAQGRRFLQDLRLSSGHTERYPTITRPDQPVPRPLFGVLVHGKSPPALTCDVADVQFEETVKKILENDLEVTNARSIQGIVWPAALTSRHIIGVCPPEKGKSTAYVPAVVSLLTDKTMYIDLPKGKGPLAVILVPTSKKARDVFEMITHFTDHKDIKQKRIRPLVLYAGGTEETESTQMSLISGCEILISTPASLLRMLEQEMTSFQRLGHMVLDDADILAKRFADQVDQIMQQFRLVLKNRLHQVVPSQIMMFASRWTRKLNEFRMRYTWEPIVVISSRVEASVYGGVKQVVTMSRWENRLSTFCSLLDTMVPTDKRVAAFTSDKEEAIEMWKGAKSRGVYCLLIHHELPEEVVTEARKQWLHSSHTNQLIVMVCTDQCYQDLAITNATDVIHYGLPDSKTKFGNRLACMFDYFVDRTANDEPQMETEGVSHVILTDKCAPRAEQLNEILQRCPSEHPPQLQEFLRGYREGVENDERKTLCPLLKAFGTCIAHNNQENCKDRHVVIPKHDFKTGEIDENSLPASGQVTIKVLRVVTAGRFYCHLVSHRGVDSPTSQDLRLDALRLAMDIAAFFAKSSNQVPYLPSEDPFYDGLCAFRDDKGDFFR